MKIKILVTGKIRVRDRHGVVKVFSPYVKMIACISLRKRKLITDLSIFESARQYNTSVFFISRL